MTSKIDPNLSRLKCIGYKYGYDHVIRCSHAESRLLRITFFKEEGPNGPKPNETCVITIPQDILNTWLVTCDFDIIANHVEEYLKQSTELDIHYV